MQWGPFFCRLAQSFLRLSSSMVISCGDNIVGSSNITKKRKFEKQTKDLFILMLWIVLEWYVWGFELVETAVAVHCIRQYKKDSHLL